MRRRDRVAAATCTSGGRGRAGARDALDDPDDLDRPDAPTLRLSRWRRPARPGRRRRPAPTTTASCPPGSRPSTPSWAWAGCRDLPRSRCAETPRRARPRSRCGWRPRHRRPVRSSPGSISPGPSIPSRPSPAASARNGSWCSPPSTSRRPSRSRLRSSRPGRWTSSSSTCPTAGTRRSAACASVTGWAGSRRWPGARGRCWWSWSRTPRTGPGGRRRGASGLRLELERTGWIRLGRDVVGQRSAVTEIARNRHGPPGRRGPRDPVRGRRRLGRLSRAGGWPARSAGEPAATGSRVRDRPTRAARHRPERPPCIDRYPCACCTCSGRTCRSGSPGPASGHRGATAPPSRGRPAPIVPRRTALDGRDGGRRTRSLGPSACAGDPRSGAPTGWHPRRPSSTSPEADRDAVEAACERLAAFSPGISGTSDVTDRRSGGSPSMSTA